MGILVHAYLMYGFPTESQQETIDSLEECGSYLRKTAYNQLFGINLPPRCIARRKTQMNLELK